MRRQGGQKRGADRREKRKAFDFLASENSTSFFRRRRRRHSSSMDSCVCCCSGRALLICFFATEDDFDRPASANGPGARLAREEGEEAGDDAVVLSIALDRWRRPFLSSLSSGLPLSLFPHLQRPCCPSLFLKNNEARSPLALDVKRGRGSALDVPSSAAKKPGGCRPIASIGEEATPERSRSCSPSLTPDLSVEKKTKTTKTTARRTPLRPTTAPRPRSTPSSRPRRTPGSTSTPTRTSPSRRRATPSRSPSRRLPTSTSGPR